MPRVASSALLSVTLLASVAMRAPQGDDRLLRLDVRAREVVSAIVDSARREGLPTETLVQYALEGATKGARGDAIVRAVRKLASNLRLAREAIGPSSSPADVEAAELAIRNGVDVKQLERLRAMRSPLRIASVANVLTYVVTSGVPADTASNVIVGLVLAGATEDQLQSLKDDVDRDISHGTSAILAMSARGQGLATQIAAAQPNNGGARVGGLPSGLGSTHAGDPGANGALGGGAGAVGAVTPGGSKPAPAGKPKKP